MKVLFVTTSYPTPEAPALAIFVQEHARAVAPHAEIAVLHLDRDESARVPYRVRGRRDEFPVYRVHYPRRPTALSVACHFAAAFAGYRGVVRGGFRPDLMHAHFFLAAGPVAALSAATGVPYVATEHWTAFLPEDPTELGPAWRAGARLALRHARMVMPVSSALESAMTDAGIRGPFRVVPNAVDAALFRAGSGGSRRLLTVAAPGPQKGVDTLLEALALLPERALDVVGDSPYVAGYEEQARSLGLAARVTFHGLQSKPRVAELMREAELFVLASRYDNNPCVLLEALCSGLPIVSTRVGGIPEIVGDDGLLVEPDDARALARAIEDALASGRWDRAEIAARARARYSFETVGASLSGIYAQALGERRGTP